MDLDAGLMGHPDYVSEAIILVAVFVAQADLARIP
ncbi:MAG: hypothetical protein BWY92_00844 [Firmicutes bacterium ADurb.BinA052]|nr:MAG: hypothetical protein BWY92_00844 [Firmicutes bacterium ADurb.BinA052]